MSEAVPYVLMLRQVGEVIMSPYCYAKAAKVIMSPYCYAQAAKSKIKIKIKIPPHCEVGGGALKVGTKT